MNEELNRLEQLFDAALELASPGQRAAFLEQACGADAALRQRVERLLRAHETAGGFLDPETPPHQSGLPLSDRDLAPCENPGDRIGHYTLVERLGEGGSCVVYRAEQAEPVRRQVALKLIKTGMDTRQVVARFEVERQVLALMDHPHIAKVFDAGVTATGRPYFVMELVRGIPITQFCDEHRMPLKQRLELFMQVCHAVQHAHQKGIIHRDLKPSNILVTTSDPESAPGPPAVSGNLPDASEGADGAAVRRNPHADGAGAPKIIDFGIAKATQMRLTDRAVVTWAGQFVGTPAYMSPEQARMNSEDIDARADIYALGVLLYELLTGVTPFDKETLAAAALDQVGRMIQHTDPPKPSTRLAQEVAVSESQNANRRSQIDRDLDWIVMKALEKDRQRRYATANDLAEDIRRHLAHEPVLAGPPSATYRARKFIRRHRAGVAVAAVATLALVAGLSLALVGLHRARQAETAAHQERDRAVQAEADARLILGLFNSQLPVGDETIGLLRAAARIARERLGPTNPTTRAFLLPSAQNLGRFGAWTNALEVYRWLIEADPGNLDFWEQAHAAALAAADDSLRRELCQGMVERFAASREPSHCLRLARSLLVDPDHRLHQEIAVACARRAFEGQPSDLACQAIQGLAEYRQRNAPEALDRLRDVEQSQNQKLAALASGFGAMARLQTGQAADARATLTRLSGWLQACLEQGELQAADWHEVVLALAARAEAERAILGQAVSPPVTAEYMARARERWKLLHEVLARGHALAGEGKWPESRDAYAQALAHPLFDWGAAEEGSLGRCLSIQMGAVFARSGDATNHLRLSRLLLALHPERPSTPREDQDATVRANRYARACFLYARSLSPELRQEALELARFALANQRRRGDHSREWVCQTAGIAEFYAGQPERAAELLLEAETHSNLAIKGPAMLYRAMILRNSDRSQEAALVLRDAELFSSSPELNMREWWFNGELYRLALEEARQSIRGATK